MPLRNYIRILPELFERKALGLYGRHGRYSPDAFAAFIGVLCFAAKQPTPGVFASEKLLRVLLEGPHNEGRVYARQIAMLVSRGDLVRGPAGTLIVDGWEELQEGNWQVADRMRRYRERQRDEAEPTVTPVTPDTVTQVTAPTVTQRTRARGSRVPGVSKGLGKGGSASVTRPADTEGAHAPPPANGGRLTGNAYASFEVLTGKVPTAKVMTWLDDECRRYGREHVVMVMYDTPEPTKSSWLNRVKDALRGKEPPAAADEGPDFGAGPEPEGETVDFGGGGAP